MVNTRSVLVATDFSESSRAALATAAAWAERLGASLDVIHVWSVPGFPLPPAVAGDPRACEALVEEPRRNAEADLAKFVESASNLGIFVRNAHLAFGNAAEAICGLAEREGYDFIVVGTRGRTGLSRLMLGSVAEKVVRRSAVPVLSVHALPARPSAAA
jgi:nucleotide-binding universal stress UspA family protein